MPCIRPVAYVMSGLLALKNYVKPGIAKAPVLGEAALGGEFRRTTGFQERIFTEGDDIIIDGATFFILA